jgi:nickel transport protein
MPSNRLAWPIAAAVLVLLAAAPAAAHEVLHEVERGRSVAVRARYPDGRGLADAQAEIYSPADRQVPAWTGRTDRHGWVAFVPDVPGPWAVRIFDASGHGTIALVDVPAPGEAGPSTVTSPLAFLLRPVLGVVLIALIVGFLSWRSSRTGPA